MHRPNVKSAINRQGLIADSELVGLGMSCSGLAGFGLTGFRFTSVRIEGSGLFGVGLANSLEQLGSGLLLIELARLGDQLDNELSCWLLIGLLVIISVSVELLLIKLLLSKRLLLWLLALLLGYSESDIMVDWRCCSLNG
jgi:hypothetical protein